VCVCFILPLSCIPFRIDTVYHLWRRKFGIVFTTDDIKYRAKRFQFIVTLSHKSLVRMRRAFRIRNRKTLPFVTAYITVVIDVCVNARSTNWLLPSRVNSLFGHRLRMLHLSLLRSGCYWLTGQNPINQTSAWNFLSTVVSGWRNWRSTTCSANSMYIRMCLAVCHKSMYSNSFYVLVYPSGFMSVLWMPHCCLR